MVQQFGKAGASALLGIGMGPLIAGILMKISLTLPFFTSSLTMALGAVTTFFMAETLLPAARKPSISLRDAFPLRETRDAFEEPRLALFALPFFLQTVAETVHSTFTLYVLRRFNWCAAYLPTYLPT
jgi:MFS family permease